MRDGPAWRHPPTVGVKGALTTLELEQARQSSIPCTITAASPGSIALTDAGLELSWQCPVGGGNAAPRDGSGVADRSIVWPRRLRIACGALGPHGARTGRGNRVRN